jgi:hypothetical protein
MKRIPFTIEAWKAGGVPLTRSGEYVKQLTYFEGIDKGEVCMIAVVFNLLYSWYIDGNYNKDKDMHSKDLFIEVPCTKYYTHYYRYFNGNLISATDQCSEPTYDSDYHTHIKTVEVEL